MKRLVTGTLAVVLAAAVSAAALAQTPKGPQDCKANEQWDATTKTCKVKK